MPYTKIILVISVSGLLVLMGLLDMPKARLAPNLTSSDCQYTRIPEYLHSIILPVGCGLQRPVKTKESPFPGYTFKSFQGEGRYISGKVIKDYEKQIYNLPPVRETPSFGCDPAKSCHLSKTCYDYEKSLFHPTSCRSRVLTTAQADKCLRDHPVTLMGDSRTKEVANGLLSTFGALGKEYIMSLDNPGVTANKTRQIRNLSGELLLEFATRSDSYNSANNRNWRPDPDSQVLILGGLGAHVFKMDRPENDLDRNVRSYAKDLRKILLDSTSSWNNSQIMDSHIPPALEHRHLCNNFVSSDRIGELKQHQNLEALGDHKYWSFKCPDNWHHGNIYGMGVAQMVLNHLCPEA